MRVPIALTMAAVLLSVAVASADVPHQISYQGRLTDDSGSGITGTADISFSLFADSSTSTMLWKETHYGVTVTDGLFNVMLGSVSSLGPSIFDGSTRYLQVAVEGQPSEDLIPVVSVAHAYRAIASDTAQYAVTSGSTPSSVWEQTTSTVYLPDVSDDVGIGTTTPAEKLHVVGNLRLEESNELQFGAGVTKLRESGGDLTVSSTDDLFLQPNDKIYLAQYGTSAKSVIDPVTTRVGFGTTAPEELLHLYNEAIDGTAFMKIQSNHLTSWHEAGLRIETPENRWHFRMDDPSHNNLSAGAISLRSQDINAEVMTWEQNGNIGIGTTSPSERLDVVGNVNVSGTLEAGSANVLGDISVGGSVSGDLDVTGSLSAGSITGNYAANSINYSDILDDVGIASAHANEEIAFNRDAWEAILERTITVPAAGYIVATGSVNLVIDHGVAGFTYGLFGVSSSSTSIPFEYRSRVRFEDNADAGEYQFTLPCQRLFHVTSAGTYTYYIVATQNPLTAGMGTVSASMRHLELLYVRTVYASSKDGVYENDPGISEDLASQATQAPDLSDSRSFDDMATRIEALERRLAELEAK